MKFLGVLYLFVLVLVAFSAASAQIDYATQIQPILDTNCKGCHVPVRSGWDVTNYTTVIASVGVQYASKVVLPGNSAGSPIVNKISATTPLHGARMPRGGPYLSDADITTIKNWIDQGALQKSSTSVLRMTSDVPVTYSLTQNYPNPFNPATRIAFSIPSAQFVTLNVFDIVGRQVASLVNGTLQPGVYSMEWNGANVTSGIYFYQLRAGDQGAGEGQSFVSTKKMILQK